MQLSKRELQQHIDRVDDTLMIGGGVGGLSAGIYLQRFRLSSLIVDKGKARSFWRQELHNYLGLPPGRYFGTGTFAKGQAALFVAKG